MKHNQIYKFDPTLKRMFEETGYKHIALESQEGERIVSYNPAKTKIAVKWDEIRRRLLAQPDGFYKILATTAIGGKSKPDVYTIQKGDVPKENLKEENENTKYVPVTRNKEETKREEVLSLPEALKRIEELASLRVENENLKSQVKQLEEYVEQLETELEELEEKEPLSEGAGMSGTEKWIKDTIPVVTPFIERYFETRDKEIALREKMFDRKKTKKPIIIQQNRRRQNQEEQITFMTMDLNNENQLNQLFDELESLDDTKFNEAFATISKQRPELAQIIADEFQLETEEEENA